MNVEDLPEPTEGLSYREGYVSMTCAVPECEYSINMGKGYEDPAYRLESFKRDHLSQHLPNRTPDIPFVDVRYSGTCTNCEGYVDCYPMGGERIWCDDCGATWDLYGRAGRTDEKLD